MLSQSAEVDYVKSKLDVGDTYGFDDEDAMTTAIETAIDDARWNYMVPAIGQALYDEIEAFDGQGLTERQKCIYLAECNFALAEFLKQAGSLVLQKRKSTSVTYSQSGVSKTYSGPNGITAASQAYLQRAYRLMRRAGFVRVASISRFGTANRWKTLEDEAYLYGDFNGL